MHVLIVRKAVRREPSGQTEINPETGKTIHGGQFAPAAGAGTEPALELWQMRRDEVAAPPKAALKAEKEHKRRLAEIDRILRIALERQQRHRAGEPGFEPAPAQGGYAVDEAALQHWSRWIAPKDMDKFNSGNERPSADTPEAARQRIAYRRALRRHEAAVRRALSDGKPVPTEVLADYPGLSISKAAATAAPPRRREPAGQREVNPRTGKTIQGGQFAPKNGDRVSNDTPEVANAEPSPAPPSARAPKGVHELLVSSIRADPARFQFRVGLGETRSGTGDALRPVQKWDPDLAGIISVWLDPEDGKTYVVNGHHRLELARRLKARRILARYIAAPNAQKALEKGALINVAEGTADPISAAKLFRARHITEKHLEASGINLQGQVARVAAPLAALCEPLWNKVARGEMETGRGAVIGRAFKTEAEQLALSAMLDRPEVKRRRLSDAAVAELAKFVDTAGRRKTTINTLFGEESLTQNLALEKAELSAAVKGLLAGDRRLFSFVSTGGRSQALERAGNRMDQAANRDIGQQAARVEEVYDRLSRFAGPLADALNDAAKELADARAERGNLANTAERRDITRRLYDRVRAVVESDIGHGAGAHPAGDGRGEHRRPAGGGGNGAGERGASRIPALRQAERGGAGGDRTAAAVAGASDTLTGPLFKALPAAVDAAARETDRNPTDGQKEAGNYKKGRTDVYGIPVAIENARGSYRTGVDRHGKRWRVRLACHYGYFTGTDGKDGDEVDVYIAPDHTDTSLVHVVNQVDPETGRFDEHKIVVGASDLEAAKRLYLANYAPGWHGLGSIAQTNPDGLRAWLRHGNKRVPFTGVRLSPDGALIRKAVVLVVRKARDVSGEARDEKGRWKAYSVAGTTSDVDECQQCGRTDLKRTVILRHERTGEHVYMGSDCAARALGYTEAEVNRRAKNAEQQEVEELQHFEYTHPLQAEKSALLKQLGERKLSFQERRTTPEWARIQEIEKTVLRDAAERFPRVYSKVHASPLRKAARVGRTTKEADGLPPWSFDSLSVRAHLARHQILHGRCPHEDAEDLEISTGEGKEKKRHKARRCRACGKILLPTHPERARAMKKAMDELPMARRLHVRLFQKAVAMGIFKAHRGHDVSKQARQPDSAQNDEGQNIHGQFAPTYTAEQKQQARKLYEEGYSRREVASMLHIPEGSIGKLLREAETPFRSKSEANTLRDPETEKKVLQYALEGKRWADIMEELGVSKIRARRILRESGASKTPAPRGLVQAVRDEVVRLYTDESLSTIEIARRLNIAEPTASKYVNAAGALRSAPDRGALGVQKRRDAGKRVGPSGISAPWYSEKNEKWCFGDSSYEIVRMAQLDADPSVKSWRKGAPIVAYGENKRYVPDFLIETTDGKKIVEEVKPRWQMDTPVFQAKADAARKHFQPQGIQYRVVDERGIGLDALENFDYDGLPFLPAETKAKLKTAAKQVRVPRWQLKKEEGTTEKAIAQRCFSNPGACGLRWITAHPNGDSGDGVPLLVHDNGEEYTVVGGAGGKLNQQVFKKPAGHDGDSTAVARKAKQREKRIERKKQAREALGEHAQEMEEKKRALQEQAKQQTATLHNRVLEALHGELKGDALAKIAKEAEKRALAEHGGATEEAKREFVEKAQKEAVAAAKDAAGQVIRGVLDRQAQRALGNDEQTAAEFKAEIAGKKVTRSFTNDELDDFVRSATQISALKGQARAIARALNTGDQDALQGIEAGLKPLSDEQVRAQNLDRYLNEQSVDTNTNLVKGSELASTLIQRRAQSNGAADGVNSFAADLTGKAILDPDTVRRIGVENAARVAAAYLQHAGVDAKGTAASLRDRIAVQSAASAQAALEKVAEMDALVQNAKDAAHAGDGAVTKAQASILAANMAAQKYRMLNTTRGQLRVAAALAHHLETPSARALSLPAGDTEVGAHAQARGLGLREGEYSVAKAQRGEGGGYQIRVEAANLHKLARPQTLAEAERNVAMDELRQDVEANPGAWRAKGFNENAALMPHQELAARAIVEKKRMVLNYGAGSGKTPTAYAAAAELISTGKVDKVLMTMPAKPRAQQAGEGGEAAKFLSPELAGQVAVVQDGRDLQKQLRRVASGEAKILILSPHLMREKVADLKAAGFGGEKSAFFADEAHEFAVGSTEGKGSGMAQAARELAKSEYAVAMSGTLIENNASEFHSVHEMIHPGALGSQKAFSEEWKRLAQGGGDFFSSEAMRGMRARLAGTMVSYHKPVTKKSADGTEEALTLERNVVTVQASPEQRAAIAQVNQTYQKEKLHDDPAIAKAAALRRDARVRRILTTGVKGADGQNVNPKHAVVQRILADEKARSPQNRIGIYAFEKAPLRSAGAAAGGRFASITGDDDDAATKASIAQVNDRGNDTDGVLLSNAANYGVNLQGMDHLIKMHPLDVPSKEDQLDHRHFRTGQTRNVRATTILTDHPAEQVAQFRNRRVKLPEVALLATLADDSQNASVLAHHLPTLQAAAGARATN